MFFCVQNCKGEHYWSSIQLYMGKEATQLFGYVDQQPRK